MEILKVDGLCKKYTGFELKDVSFSLEKGYIMGFIGRNGAGKTTTLKSMMNLVHPDKGSVEMCGMDFASNELECKKSVSFMLGGADYYSKKRLKTITDVVRRFYDEWDDDKYRELLKRFELDENKRIEELSQGMTVKYGLALAMSHNAKLLMLDEPTSGLDPVSRDDLLELFQELIEDGERSILFSTHITSDLDKCADFITYIKDGKIIASTEKDTFVESYRVVRGTNETLTPEMQTMLIGIKKHAFGFNALALAEDVASLGLESAKADVETIMVHIESEDLK